VPSAPLRSNRARNDCRGSPRLSQRRPFRSVRQIRCAIQTLSMAHRVSGDSRYVVGNRDCGGWRSQRDFYAVHAILEVPAALPPRPTGSERFQNRIHRSSTGRRNPLRGTLSVARREWARALVLVLLSPNRVLLECELHVNPRQAIDLAVFGEGLLTACKVTLTGVDVLKSSHQWEGVCQVCGTVFDRNAVCCEACRTPHHPECWEYLTRCSTFACSGRRAIPWPPPKTENASGRFGAIEP